FSAPAGLSGPDLYARPHPLLPERLNESPPNPIERHKKQNKIRNKIQNQNHTQHQPTPPHHKPVQNRQPTTHGGRRLKIKTAPEQKQNKKNPEKKKNKKKKKQKSIFAVFLTLIFNENHKKKKIINPTTLTI
ncbi:hypothetical protein, partial [Pseudomonas syringae group genomosp. 7]|uniref:hypothetical protein n=1 Tax=Pseudomonas syringae group genomosp. 7 TaxID=251699 RepID=UPI00376F70B6